MAIKNIPSRHSSDALVSTLCERLNDIRLAQNISQAELAQKAGVSHRTVTRLAAGEGVSLDSFVRVALALNLADHLHACLPDPAIRPVERVGQRATERQRASKRSSASENTWQWGDGKPSKPEPES